MAEPASPTYSIVTTCKGRLDDLKKSLPRFAAQPDAEVIVVDYDCPEHCGEWVATEFPAVKVVAVPDRPLFNLPDARNHGAKMATGKVLVFLDADIIVAEDFLERTKFPGRKKVFGAFEAFGNRNSLRGSSMIRRVDFEALEGFDELLSGYGGEDLDMYMRLRISGAEQVDLDEAGIEEVIEQTREERQRHRPPNLTLQFLRGQLYQLAKELVMRSHALERLDLPARKQIMAMVDRQVGPLFKGEKDFEMTIELPDLYQRRFLKRWEFTTAVSVRAKRKSGD